MQNFHLRGKLQYFPCIVRNNVLNYVARELEIVHFMQEYHAVIPTNMGRLLRTAHLGLQRLAK
jgi:hypothetical protein